MLQQCDRTKRHPATWQAVPLAKLSEGDSATHHSKLCQRDVDTLHVSVPGYQIWRGEQGSVSYGWLKDTSMHTDPLTKVGEGIDFGLTSWEKLVSPSPGIVLHLS